MTARRARQLTFSEDGFTAYSTAGSSFEVHWELVREIVAFRLDPDGEDLMCLGFRISNDQDYIEISEETPKYKELLVRMCEAFPDIDRNWWQSVATSYGTTTIHGISQSQQQSETTAAERYLAQAGKRKPMTPKARKKIIPAIIAIIIAAGVQTLLSWWIAGLSGVAAVAIWPMLLIIAVARFWPNPRLFFTLLGGYHLAELGCHFLLGRPGPCLLSQLLAGKFQYLLLLGVEILLGLGVMLLPDKHAAGRRPK